MSFDDVRMVLFEQRMHLFNLLRRQSLDHVELVVGVVEARPALARRFHRFRTFGKRAQEARIVDAETLAKVAKD